MRYTSALDYKIGEKSRCLIIRSRNTAFVPRNRPQVPINAAHSDPLPFDDVCGAINYRLLVLLDPGFWLRA